MVAVPRELSAYFTFTMLLFTFFSNVVICTNLSEGDLSAKHTSEEVDAAKALLSLANMSVISVPAVADQPIIPAHAVDEHSSLRLPFKKKHAQIDFEDASQSSAKNARTASSPMIESQISPDAPVSLSSHPKGSKSRKPYPLKYEEKTEKGLFRMITLSLMKKGSYQVSFTLSNHFSSRILFLNTKDLKYAMSFPFSTKIVSSVTSSQGATGKNAFSAFVNAIESVSNVSLYFHEQTGHLFNVAGILSKKYSNVMIEDTLLQFFVPALLAYVDKCGMSKIEPLRPLIAPMFARVSKHAYFKAPLQIASKFMSYPPSINIEVNSQQTDDVTECEQVDLPLIQIVYSQLGQSLNAEIESFFSNLWSEISKKHDENSELMKTFHTLKFIEIIENMANSRSFVLDESKDDYIFKSFAKFYPLFRSSKFIRAAFPFEHLKDVCTKIYQILMNIPAQFENGSKSLTKDYVGFLDRFVGFLNFYVKYYCYIEYRNFISRKSTRDETLQRTGELRQSVENLNELATIMLKFNVHPTENPVSSSDLDVMLDIFQKLQPKAYSSSLSRSVKIIAKEKSKNISMPLRNSNLETVYRIDSFERMIEILSHEYDSVAASYTKFHQCMLKTVLLLTRVREILGKNHADWTIDDKNWFHANQSFFTICNQRHFESLYVDREEQKAMLLKFILKSSIDTQRLHFHPKSMKGNKSQRHETDSTESLKATVVHTEEPSPVGERDPSDETEPSHAIG